MRYLIDTNIFLFYTSDSSFLDRSVRTILENYENIIYISSESVKEAIHLFQTGKVKKKSWKTASDIINSIENESGITIKYVTREHLLTFAALDRVERHNDPNDRLIIA
ncbi:MAG: PIN domain-containing protein, partial [Dysgonamonadaceae bacterium]|nr:PIN domain-containing protein [Dysgonamonadaceae bacterium]